MKTAALTSGELRTGTKLIGAIVSGATSSDSPTTG